MAMRSGSGKSYFLGILGLLAAWALLVPALTVILWPEPGVAAAFQAALDGGDWNRISAAGLADPRLPAFVLILLSPVVAFVAGRASRHGENLQPAVDQPDQIGSVDSGAEESRVSVDPDGVALRLLATLQEEARLLDFIAEDVASYSDDQVGAAARGVHAGLVRALKERVSFSPLRSEEEGDTVTLEDGYSPASVRLVGSPSGEAPWKGCLVHPGWIATRVALPQPTGGGDSRILAPAEIEVESR